MPPKRTSSASARQKPSPAKQKTSSSHSSSMPRPQPTIASFFSRQTSSSSSQVHPSSPSQQNFQHPTPPQPVPDPDPRPSPSRIGPSNPIAPSDPLSLACRDDVIDLDQTDQIDCDAALARKLAGDDDQSYYDHPKPRNPCLNVSLSPVRPPSLPTPQSTIAAVKPAPGCASAPMISYELDQDVLEFEPSQLDISSWPLASLLPQSPKKERHQDNLGDATTPTRAGARRVPYSFLVAAFLLITQTKSRLTITTVMTNLLRSVIEHDQSSLLSTVYLITNHFGPAYEGIELGIGSQVLSKALKAVSDVSSKQLKTLWNMHGDPGDVAFEARKSVRTLFGSTLSTLTVQSVFDTFSQLAKLKGPGSLDAKTDAIKKLLVAARGEEVRFLIRVEFPSKFLFALPNSGFADPVLRSQTACRNLRIGAVKLTVTSALARAFCLTRPPNPQSMAHARAYWIAPESRRGIKAVVPKELTGKAKTAEAEKADRKEVISVLARAERVVREVYVRHPNYDDIIPALLEPGCLEELSKNISLTIGIPISPMLGQITRDLKDVEARLVNKEQEFVAE